MPLPNVCSLYQSGVISLRLAVLAVVELVERLDGDAAEQLAGEDAQQGPGEVQGVEDGTVLVGTLCGHING